jgi:Alanyl-tRNA synthetase
MAMDKVGIKEKLWDLIEIQKERFKDILDLSMERSAREIIELEEERFRDLLLKGDQLILKYAKKGVLTQEAINTLFQSNGLPIEYTIERARQLGIKLPDKVEKAKGFVNVREPAQKKEKPKIVNKYNPTKKSYYEDERKLEFKGNVLGAEGNYLILDETYFYPEGGGQPSDHGYIVLNGNKYEVRDVQLVDDVVVHILDKEIQANKGDIILGHIDEERRIRLMQHHSGTHILLSSIRYVLGNHVWQAGAQKDPYLSRLDITHYKDINAEEIKQIERRANEVIQMNLRLRKEFVERNQAEQKYGFILYQGGIPEGKQLRLVEIPGVDVEGCGGTHVDRTGDVGLIKIIKIEKYKMEYTGSILRLEDQQLSIIRRSWKKFQKLKISWEKIQKRHL